MSPVVPEMQAPSESGPPVSTEALSAAARRIVDSAFRPVSMYRLQLGPHLGFRAAARVAAYLRDLGVHTVYTSPYFQSVTGSEHGYNVTDPNRLNSELGSEEDYEAFIAALHQAGMGHVLDFVPNHMGIRGPNALWLDVLENGPDSVYAGFFDVDWEPVKRELKDKVLLPFLGDLYGKVLEAGEIRLSFADGELKISYRDFEFPVAPDTYPDVLGQGSEELEEALGAADSDFGEYLSVLTAFRNLAEGVEGDAARAAERHREKRVAKARLAALAARNPRVAAFVESRVARLNGRPGAPDSFDALDGLLNRQHYRLAHWTVASEEINYRRFFNINELAALRMEDERVFEHCHTLVFRLLLEGRVDGLRIDHPDGLYDPPAYFRRLQEGYLRRRLAAEAPAASLEDVERALAAPGLSDAVPVYVIVEKILDRHEALPERWRVHGTVGYDFLNALNGVFIDPSSAGEMDRLYERFIEHAIDMDQLVYDKKKSFAMLYMSSEINALGHRLDVISERNRRFRDFTRNNLTLAIREMIDCFPVYRTYVPSEGAPSERDERYIRDAAARAKRRTPALNPAIYDFVRDVLLLKLEGVGDEETGLYRDFVLRFQQLTGPIMAKGLEDTAFYVNNRLLSLNEVGGDPSHFGYSSAEFHRMNAERARRWPFSATATSTHDTKRSHDVRMRLNVLTEMPGEWRSALAQWAALNDRHKTSLDGVLEPRRNTEYFIYQTLLGAWPDGPLDDAAHEELRERLWTVILKSLREAKIYTNWVAPNPAYEEAVRRFFEGILDRGEENFFPRVFMPFRKKVSRCGKWNSLSSLVLKFASPGVPDTFQGEELWHYALVDPDNRRPVDFGRAAALLAEVRREGAASPAEAAARWASSPDDGRIKLFTLWRLFAERSRSPGLYLGGAYEGLEAEGPLASNVVAFARRQGDEASFAVCGRFFARLGAPAGETWRGTRLCVPDLPRRLRDVFTGNVVEVDRGCIDLERAFGALPYALLIPEGT